MPRTIFDYIDGHTKEGRLIQAYVIAKRINSYSYSFVPDHSDYYFVLDNGYSWFTNK